NYSGTENPVKKAADLLPDILCELGKKSRDPSAEIFRYWQSLMGEKMAPYTEPMSFIEEVLTVKVKNSTLYSLLAGPEKRRLLKKLQEKFSIRNLVFRVG
ncbi:MAG: DUF721 domain-containing protein, partial [Verrucomicrobia bacterium]|nr:DUF721 domain-containing protein [Verrucomicrobiota bacterium]